MDQEQKKIAVGAAAVEYVPPNAVLGVGTGSTVNAFIDQLVAAGTQLAGAVSSSEASSVRLREAGIRLIDLDDAGRLDVYIDGADEVDPALNLIKGGGGALTREKIVAAAARSFVCIVDDSKCVDVLGAFPLPVEVIPMAAGLVGDALVELGGRPVLRDGFITDNGNVILDVHDLSIDDPRSMERRLNQLAGVVTVGLFAARGADVLLVSGDAGVTTRLRSE